MRQVLEIGLVVEELAVVFATEFREDLDLDQFVFEFGSVSSAYHYGGRLLGNPDAAERALKQFEALLERAH